MHFSEMRIFGAENYFFKIRLVDLNSSADCYLVICVMTTFDMKTDCEIVS